MMLVGFSAVDGPRNSLLVIREKIADERCTPVTKWLIHMC